MDVAPQHRESPSGVTLFQACNVDSPDAEGHFLASPIWAVNGEYFTAPGA